MKNIVRYSITAGILVALISFTVIKLFSNKKEVEAKVFRKDPNRSATVQADTIRNSPFRETASFLGSFTPNREVTISSETTGKVMKVGIQEGSQVGAGALIAQLDTELLQAQLQSARASHDNASATLKRYEQAASGVTQLQLDNARTQLLTAQAQLDQLKKQIAMCTIRAPFGGIITSRSFELGAVVATGTQMAQLVDISRLKLEINVPEKSITQFRKGQTLTVVTDVYPEASFKGIVDMIAVQADASHNYAVKIIVTNSTVTSLKSGMYGRVSLTDSTSGETMSIPRSALVGSSTQPQVFVIESGIARLRDIQTGAGNESRVQVNNGLQPGDVIAIGGLVNLVDGGKVTIVK
jgi:RND family efflux transporter MFP subunit